MYRYDDRVNEFLETVKKNDYDGYVFGVPVHFGSAAAWKQYGMASEMY